MIGYLRNLNTYVYIDGKNIGGSGGNLKKWVGYITVKCKCNKVYIKTNSSRKGFTAYESEVECVVYEIAKELGFPVLPYYYDIMTLEGIPYVVCISFDYSSDFDVYNLVEMIPNISKYNGMAKYKLCVKTLKENNVKDVEKYFSYILFLDYIMNNGDRHLRNIEVVMDKQGNSFFTPIFDNGAGLFSNESEHSIKFALRRKSNNFSCKPFFCNTYYTMH